MDRIAQLRKFAQARPTDPFPRYALALEQRSAGNVSGAIEELSTLTGSKPDYVPAYLILGQLHEQAGHVDDARRVYREGQGQARTQGNAHALSELTSALAQLGD